MNISFYSLPHEVISRIFTGLDSQSLARSCSVSKLFHQIAWKDDLFEAVVSNTITFPLPKDDIKKHVNDHFAVSGKGLLKQIQKFVDQLKLGDNATLVCHYPHNPDLTLDCLWNSSKNRQEEGASSDSPATILFCLTEASQASHGVAFRIEHRSSRPIYRDFEGITSRTTLHLDSIEYKCVMGFRNKRNKRQDVRLFKNICEIFAKKASDVGENLYQEKKKISLEKERSRIAYMGTITCLVLFIFAMIHRVMNSYSNSTIQLPPPYPPCGQWSVD